MSDFQNKARAFAESPNIALFFLPQGLLGKRISAAPNVFIPGN